MYMYTLCVWWCQSSFSSRPHFHYGLNMLTFFCVPLHPAVDCVLPFACLCQNAASPSNFDLGHFLVAPMLRRSLSWYHIAIAGRRWESSRCSIYVNTRRSTPHRTYGTMRKRNTTQGDSHRRMIVNTKCKLFIDCYYMQGELFLWFWY